MAITIEPPAYVVEEDGQDRNIVRVLDGSRKTIYKALNEEELPVLLAVLEQHADADADYLDNQ